MDNVLPGGASAPEKLLTFKEAADQVGAKYWHIQRAVKRGDIPSYTPFNSRRLVKLSEVVAYINSCRQGARRSPLGLAFGSHLKWGRVEHFLPGGGQIFAPPARRRAADATQCHRLPM